MRLGQGSAALGQDASPRSLGNARQPRRSLLAVASLVSRALRRRRAGSAWTPLKAAGRRLTSTFPTRERRRHGGDNLAAALHRTETAAQLRRQLLDLIARLIADAAANGNVRDDVPPSELASFAIHALDAAGDLTSQAAQTRLVDHRVWKALATP
jgi:hypothetical protein